MLPSETCLRLPRGLPRVEFPCGGCPFPPTGFTSRLRKPCKEGTHRKTDTNEAVNSANVTNCRAPIGFPPCKTTPSTYNWPHGACKTKMKQGGPENSQATRRTARLFNKVLRYGQLCSARNGRKIFTETSFALMVSGATTHHSMLCQLRPLAAWGLQNQNEIHLYRVVFLVFCFVVLWFLVFIGLIGVILSKIQVRPARAASGHGISPCICSPSYLNMS